MYTEAPPRWLSAAAKLALFGTLAATALVLVAILIGFTDPQPIGRLVVDDRLTALDGWTASSSMQEWEASPEGLKVVVTQIETRIFLTSPYALTDAGTIEITARQMDGASDSVFGVWWGGEQGWTAAAISGDGYFGVPSVREASDWMVADWHRFPWLRPQGESNRIRVDFSADGQVQVRLNDEVAAAFTYEGHMPADIGLYVETTRRGGSVARFERLRMWQGTP